MLRSLFTFGTFILSAQCCALAPPAAPAGCDNRESVGPAKAARTTHGFSGPASASTMSARRNSASLAANVDLVVAEGGKATWSIYAADEWRAPEDVLLNIQGLGTNGSTRTAPRSSGRGERYNLTGKLRDPFRSLPYFFVRLVVDDPSGGSVQFCSFANRVGDVDPVISVFTVDTKAEKQ